MKCEQLRAVLLGTALGDSVGLPAEGLSRRKIEKLGWGGENWRQRLLFGRGMCSDDTEHSVMVLQSILEADGDVAVFRKRFARRLRWWVLGLPAGVGMATARAALKLWFGVSPERSGVFSAGNGSAMRSAIIGAYFAENRELRAAFISASTVLTHSDPKALVGAMAVAELAAHPLAKVESAMPILRRIGVDDPDWVKLLDQIEESLAGGDSVVVFANVIGCGDAVGGYVYESVPVAIYAWLRHGGSGGNVVTAVLDCGGDTDTVAAIAGGLCGASSGIGGFPDEWLSRLMEWPRSVAFMDKLASCPKVVPKAFWGAVLLRNVLFLFVVLLHELLRYFPGGLRLFK